MAKKSKSKRKAESASALASASAVEEQTDSTSHLDNGESPAGVEDGDDTLEQINDTRGHTLQAGDLHTDALMPLEESDTILETIDDMPQPQTNLEPRLSDIQLAEKDDPLPEASPQARDEHEEIVPSSMESASENLPHTNAHTLLPDESLKVDPIDHANGHAEQRDAVNHTTHEESAWVQHEIQRLVTENESLRKDLMQTTDEKTQTEAQYRSLFGKVTQMKTTLGARLKQDAEELNQNRATIEELESQILVLNETIAHMQGKLVQATEETSAIVAEKSSARAETVRLNGVIDELQASLIAERAMRTSAEEKNMMTAAEWENLAIEERTVRDTLRDRIHDLEEQLSAQNSAYENLRNIVEQDNQSITKLKQQAYDTQEAHERELQQGLASRQTVIDNLTEQKSALEARIESMRVNTHDLESDLEKLRPYEQEVKEKNLLIGKLRHEAVILNEHLTKALRLLKRGASNDSVDRQLLNNLLLSFFQLPRQDSKRFEVLKILASVLAWDDLQKEQAGLLRPGSGAAQLAPLSPNTFRSPPASPNLSRSGISRRTSGAIQLQAADFMGPNRESMSDLWINFLQSEAAMNAADAAEAG